MKKILFLLCFLISAPSMAGGGGGFAGATELTQIRNNAELALQYAQQLTAYSTQLNQYQAQLQNLARNPSSQMGTDVNRMINGIGGIMTAGNSIGGTMASIDQKFGQTFNSPTALKFSDRFKQLTSTSTDTLGASMRAAGLHRDAYATDATALQALYDRSQSSDGTVAAVQQLSAINTMQIQQTQGLKDLIATQNVASSTWMAAQEAKSKQLNIDQDNLAKPYTDPIPEVGKMEMIQWGSVFKKK